MKTKLLVLFIFCLAIFQKGTAQDTLNADTINIDSLIPQTQVVEPTPLEPAALIDYKVNLKDGKLLFESNIEGLATIDISGETVSLQFNNGKATHNIDTDERGKLLVLKSGIKKSDYRLLHVSQYRDGSYRSRSIPLWMSIIPPLIAIIFALLFKEVIVSLFLGVWSGVFIAGGMRLDSFYYFTKSFLEVIEKYVIGALNDGGHLAVIVFSLLIGGMVAIISRNGGMAGVVLSLSKYATSPRRAQFITWLLGVAIFFDDYANTLIVGNTMRSVTDKFKISREKLAYIVDSTAAPVSAIAFITTWIGAELGYIEGAIATLDGFDTSLSPYAIFISSLKYSLYPILTLIFILILVFTKRDFGAMLKAETRARTTGAVSNPKGSEGVEETPEDLNPVKGAPLNWYNAVIPVMTVILMTIYGLVDTGMASCYGELMDNNVTVESSAWSDTYNQINYLVLDKESIAAGQAAPSIGFTQKLGILIGKSDSYAALLWASFMGVVMAIFMTLIGRIMSLGDTMNTMMTGFKAMLPALCILALAWSLATITDELHTANFLTSMLEGNISPYLMPPLIFILAAAIAFSTGSSWSTMAILYPIAIPATWAICSSAGIDPSVSMEILYNVIAVVLAASVLGDHCSPISDTTILSSLASDCNHIDHVRTQLPYAMTVGVISLIGGTLVTFFGGGGFISLMIILASICILTGIVLAFGKQVD